MTAVEAMAKAISDAFDGRPGWHERCAIATLAALEAIHLPDHALNAAGSLNDTLTRQEFKAIIRALNE